MGEGMIASHIHDALAQVKRLQEVILSKQFFRGYSGKARMISGTIALAASAIIDSKYVPYSPEAHLTGWCVVLAAGLMVNYVALFYWFLFDPETRRNPVMLKPALDAVPALAVGGVLTVTMINYDQFDMLFGIWMSLYGLAQTAYRQSLPRGIYLVGIGYIASGAYCLIAPSISFLDPWPMGIVFFAGEWIGGIVLILNETKTTKEQQ
jgi:hypothetical protein